MRCSISEHRLLILLLRSPGSCICVEWVFPRMCCPSDCGLPDCTFYLVPKLSFFAYDHPELVGKLNPVTLLQIEGGPGTNNQSKSLP